MPDRSTPDADPTEVLRADLRRIRAVLVEAELTGHPSGRHAAAQRAALGVAAVVLALRGVQIHGRHDVWDLLGRSVPEYAEWAGFFAATAQLPGAPRLVSSREADDLVRDAGAFADVVARRLDTLERHRRDFPGPRAVG